MVFWGRTYGGINTGDGELKDQINLANAKLLGFDSESIFSRTYHPPLDGFGEGGSFASLLFNNLHGQTYGALEVDRYYVVLRAFDFQQAWRHRKLKLLWETRFSISQRGHLFDQDIPAMASVAAPYFGQNPGRLILAPVKEGRIDIGAIRSLGPVPSANLR
jgi:hypothetical protein